MADRHRVVVLGGGFGGRNAVRGLDGGPSRSRVRRRRDHPTRSRIGAAGVQATPLARLLGDKVGVAVDRAGRLPVEPDCSVPGHRSQRLLGRRLRNTVDNVIRQARTLSGSTPRSCRAASIRRAQACACGSAARRTSSPSSVSSSRHDRGSAAAGWRWIHPHRTSRATRPASDDGATPTSRASVDGVMLPSTAIRLTTA
jgi:hypothetical protein